MQRTYHISILLNRRNYKINIAYLKHNVMHMIQANKKYLIVKQNDKIFNEKIYI